MAEILIIDDDRTICDMLTRLVKQIGHEASCEYTLDDGLKEAQSKPYDVVLLDVQMPDGSGLDILPRIRETASAPEVIIMTGFGNVDGAEMAIKNGAWDYIQKTDSIKRITLPLQRVIQYREGIKKARKPAVALKLDGIVGTSPQMKACFDLVAQAATSDANVLLTGETGTGKELFARAIHENSIRSGHNFVVVDCAALPETLVESLLFGHKRGAYTGADTTREGLIAKAHGGTLFLDEIGELPFAIQRVFLRVLQEHRFRPVGSEQEVMSDFRLVTATNRDLDYMVENHRFREDLLFRIRALNITLPPLREHMEDIKPLVMHHVARLCEGKGIGTKGFSPDFFDMLMAYPWSGNVRELVGTLEIALSTAGTEQTLFSRHLPNSIRIHAARISLARDLPFETGQEEGVDSVDTLPTLKTFRKAAAAKAEKEYLEKLLSFTRGRAREACRISGLSRSRFYELLKHHKISPAR